MVKSNLAGRNGGSKAFSNQQQRQWAKFRREAIEIEAAELRAQTAAGRAPITQITDAAIEAAERRVVAVATWSPGKQREHPPRVNVRALTRRERACKRPATTAATSGSSSRGRTSGSRRPRSEGQRTPTNRTRGYGDPAVLHAGFAATAKKAKRAAAKGKLALQMPNGSANGSPHSKNAHKGSSRSPGSPVAERAKRAQELTPD